MMAFSHPKLPMEGLIWNELRFAWTREIKEKSHEKV